MIQALSRVAISGRKRAVEATKILISPAAAMFVVFFAASVNPAQSQGAYTTTKINGWTDHVSTDFSKRPKDRDRILGKIKVQTATISKTLPAKQLKVLRKADLWIEADSHYRSLARYHGTKGAIYQEGLSVKNTAT